VTAVIYRGRLERRLSVMAFMMRLSFRKATPDPEAVGGQCRLYARLNDRALRYPVAQSPAQQSMTHQ
jgi:hypothetical protein